MLPNMQKDPPPQYYWQPVSNLPHKCPTPDAGPKKKKQQLNSQSNNVFSQMLFSQWVEEWTAARPPAPLQFLLI